jgi:type I restriction enzyme M protein
VERPLRLNFSTSPDRIERLKAERAVLNLAFSKKKGKAAEKEITDGEADQQRVLDALSTLDSGKIWRDRGVFEPILEDAISSHEVKLTAPLRKALLNALGERDETAEICRDAEGNPEPDSELRDYENVPLKEDIHEYFEREVRPHVSDAWNDEEKTRVGYEIPITRHFYKYSPPRPLEEIQAEIAGLELEIMGMLRKVVG